LHTIDEDTLVVVDGAYQEYASFKDEKKRICPKDLIEKFPNTVYLGTFSKAYALGGMRVGYGLAKEDIISTFYKIRAPFNITTLSLAAAIEALKDEEFVKDCIEKNFIEMKRYEKYCQDNGFEYIPSYTNFITILLKNFISKTVAQKLLEKGMIVRDLTGYGLNAIRITIGTNEQNTKLFKLLDEVLEELK
jgi:histidinol-phosphate aminotransferase